MRITGRCHCGAVAFEADINPANVTICHCTDCQTLTGSAFRVSITARREDIWLNGQEPALYVKTGDSGRRRLQYFCGACGSPLFTSGDGDASSVWGIRWGSIDQRAELVPRKQIWRRSAAAWLGQVDALPAYHEE